MNFVLFHMGTHLPDHIKTCIQQIHATNPNNMIYFITNFTISCNEDYLKIISTSSLQIPDIGNYYLHDPMGPLFRNAMLRIFYLESFMKTYNIENVIHFDNDVLIYENISNIENELIKHNVILSCADSKNYSFGFSYIKNYISLNRINEQLYKLIIRGERQLQIDIGSMPHEMRLLNYINENNQYIDLFPILPTDHNYPLYDYCFDPSSYGQYLGGAKPEIDKFVGEHLISKTIEVLFQNKKPIINMNGQSYKIFNLHIHNKQLKDFV